MYIVPNKVSLDRKQFRRNDVLGFNHWGSKWYDTTQMKKVNLVHVIANKHLLPINSMYTYSVFDN